MKNQLSPEEKAFRAKFFILTLIPFIGMLWSLLIGMMYLSDIRNILRKEPVKDAEGNVKYYFISERNDAWGHIAGSFCTVWAIVHPYLLHLLECYWRGY